MLAPPTVRRLATLGGNLGRSSPAADTAPALLVLDASVVIHGPAGERNVPIAEFHLGPGRNCLAPGEVVGRPFFEGVGEAPAQTRPVARVSRDPHRNLFA